MHRVLLLSLVIIKAIPIIHPILQLIITLTVVGIIISIAIDIIAVQVR